MFKAQILIVYCDADDKEAFKRTLDTMVDLRKRFPLELKPQQTGEFDVDRDNDVLFVISTTPNLMFYNFNLEDFTGPQALLMPFGQTYNSLETHLGVSAGILKTIDDLAVKEWLAKARNAET